MAPKFFNKKHLSLLEEDPNLPVYYRNNDTVPAPSGDGLGRQTMFEPVLTFSPVLSSQRTEQQARNRRSLITVVDVDELTSRLDSMLLWSGGGSSSNRNTSTDIVIAENETSNETKSEANNYNATSAFDIQQQQQQQQQGGRFDDVVYSKKSNKQVPVKRSTRLATRKGLFL